MLSTVAWGGFVDQQQWYVDGDASFNGNGSEAAPFNSLATMAAAINAGSRVGKTIHLAGRFEGEAISLLNLEACEFRQWQGRPQAVIRGDIAITSAWSEHVPGARYSVPIHGMGSLASVVEDWDSRVDSQQRHFGHLKPVTSTAGVEKTPSSWFYDGKLLHIHASGDENPNANGRIYAWCRNGNGWFFNAPQGLVLDGLEFALWVDRTAGSGYGVLMGAASDCEIRNCRANDYGYHGFGFAGTRCTDNVIENCETRGGRDNGSTAYVFFSSSEPVIGCRGYDNVAHQYPLLDATGDELVVANGRVNGFFAHAGLATTVQDVEYHRCLAIGYDGAQGTGLDGARFVTAPSDFNDPLAYGIRYFDCQVINGATHDVQPAVKIAYVRCSFDLLRTSQWAPPSLTAFGTIPGFGSTQLLFESCVIATNTDGLPDGRMFGLVANSRLVFNGCVLYDHGLDSFNSRSFFRLAANSAVVRARQSVFAHRTQQRLLTSSVTVPAANEDFEDCWYFGINPTVGYSSNPSFSTQALFQAGSDPAGVFGTDPQFAQAPLNLEGAAGGALRTATLVISGVDRVGINMNPYSGHYGAHQYGALTSCDADMNRSGSVDGIDLGLLLSWWSTPPNNPGCLGATPCAADFNGDGVVNGVDLGQLLAAWGPCGS